MNHPGSVPRARRGGFCRVERQRRDQLVALARHEHKSLGEVIQAAGDRYERAQFFAEYQRSSAALRADPEASANFEAEVALWDTTSGDGLEGDQWSDEERSAGATFGMSSWTRSLVTSRVGGGRHSSCPAT